MKKHLFLYLGSLLMLMASLSARAQYDAPSVVWPDSDAEASKWSSESKDGKTTLKYSGNRRVNGFIPFVFVDLGITDYKGQKIMWAAQNMGASSPTESGDYYAWGELKPKSEYSWSNYQFGNGQDENVPEYGASVLKTDDDVAYQKLGEQCFVPSLDDMELLTNDSDWQYTSNYQGSGVAGFIIYKKKYDAAYTADDNHIFMPMAGSYSGTELTGQGTKGNYWLNFPIYQRAISFMLVDEEGKQYYSGSYSDRCIGMNIRPVRRKAAEIYIDRPSAYVYVGYPQQIKAGTSPSNMLRSVSWTSSNPQVATVNATGIVTGHSVGETTITATRPDGYSAVCRVYVDYPLLNGRFSVSNRKAVRFSKGNLQYRSRFNDWRLAFNQYDVIISPCISTTERGFCDLFGWGTWLDGEGTKSPCDIDIYDGNQFIWSGQPAICSKWTILSEDEWQYLLEDRVTDSGIRYAKSTVHGRNGLVLLPDFWDKDVYTFENANDKAAGFAAISDANWEVLEANDAVFLPCAGWGYGSTTTQYTTEGRYWTSTSNAGDEAEALLFYISSLANSVTPGFPLGRNDELSVRFVEEIKEQ